MCFVKFVKLFSKLLSKGTVLILKIWCVHLNKNHTNESVWKPIFYKIEIHTYGRAFINYLQEKNLTIIEI